MGMSTLDEELPIDSQVLVVWSPHVERMLEAGRRSASLDELCAAILSVSDNAAANLVLEEIGGP
jgi:beta-lactamase class A